MVIIWKQLSVASWETKGQPQKRHIIMLPPPPKKAESAYISLALNKHSYTGGEITYRKLATKNSQYYYTPTWTERSEYLIERMWIHSLLSTPDHLTQASEDHENQLNRKALAFLMGRSRVKQVTFTEHSTVYRAHFISHWQTCYRTIVIISQQKKLCLVKMLSTLTFPITLTSDGKATVFKVSPSM